MAFTMNGSLVQAITLKMPLWGNWTVRCKLASDTVYKIGAVATIIVGDLTLTGTVRQGGVFQSSAEYVVVGGKDGWSKQAVGRSYRRDQGVKLLEVATDLGVDVGEKVVLMPNINRSVGYAWARAAGLASIALETFGTRWWVGPDGTTFLGPRLATTIPSTVKWTLSSFDPAKRLAVIGIADDTVKSFQPGVRIKSSDIDIVANSVIVTVNDRRVVVEVRA
jgi:hypothetical protein